MKVNKENLEAEFYLPTIVNKIINSGKANVQVLTSNAKWFGVTYKEDKEIVQKAIEELKRNKVYPTKLW